MFNTTSEALVKQEMTTEQVMFAILEVARTPGVDISIAERLFAMQERMVKDQRKIDFDDAMQRLQAKMPQIGKYGKGKNSKFAKYEDIDAIVRPLLAEEHFSISFSEESQSEGKVRFALEVSRAGHSKFYYLTITVDSAAQNREGKSIRPAIQDDGSTTSYARRYLLKMALNIVETGEDTDGEKSEAINGEEIATIRRLIKETGDEAGFLKYMKVEKIEDITVGNFKTALNALHTRKQAPPQSSQPANVTETKQGVYEPKGQVDVIAWFKRIENATMDDLISLKTDIKQVQFTDDEKKTAIALLAARHKQLTDKPAEKPPVAENSEPFI